MTDLDTLHGLRERWVIVTDPDNPRRVWQGLLMTVWDRPTIVLEFPGQGHKTFPAEFHVEDADPSAVSVKPETGEFRPWADLRSSGLLWLINRVAFHPRGLALALHADGVGGFTGWSLLANDEGEPWQFDITTDYDGYKRAEATLAAARTCGEHPGPCFPEQGATCPAHGDQRCAECHRNPDDCLKEDGNCTTWSRTGMHWDTCESRVFGPLTAPTPEAPTLPVDVLVHNALVKSAPTVLGSKLAGPLRSEHYIALTREVVAAIGAPAPPRLLACGRCYEENGEEVHPHPECPIVTAAADAISAARGGIVQTPTVIGETGCDLTIPYAAARSKDDLDPAAPGVPRCNATLETRYQGIAACWRRADHSAREGTGYELHVGQTDHGGRYQWGDAEPGTTPHRPDPAPCTATARDPYHGLAHCEQHVVLHPDGRLGSWHQGTSQDGSQLYWKDGEPGTAPHRPDPAPSPCTATRQHPHRGLTRCEDQAEHYTSDYCTHRGRTPDGTPMQWRDGDCGSTPHNPDTVRTVQDARPDTDDTTRTPTTPDTDTPAPASTDTVRTMSGPRCITIHAPGEATVLAARHLDISEGPVQTGYTVDAATRSAITRVLDYIAEAHNSPTAPSSPDTARTTCPDTGPDNPDGVRMLYTARVPRSQMGAAWADGLDHLHNLLAGHQADHDHPLGPAEREEETVREALHNLLAKGHADAADQPVQDAPATADDKPQPATTYGLTLGPDSLTDTERERKTILDTLNAELSNDEPEAVWALTLEIQRALEAMPRYAGTARLGTAEQEAAPANDDLLDITPEEADAILDARLALLDQVGPGISPRPTECSSHDSCRTDNAQKEVDVLRARVGELAATLAETIGHFTIPANLNGAVLRTGYVPAATVERWRRVHTGNGPTGWMFPPVQGHCPACNRGSLFLGSGGYVSCSHVDCPSPEAPTYLLDNHEALAEAEERARRATVAYDGLRCDVITAAAYIRQQKDRVGPFSSLRHSRSRILTVLPTWIKDPGPLDPPATPTEER